jgi:hypothetical protein
MFIEPPGSIFIAGVYIMEMEIVEIKFRTGMAFFNYMNRKQLK